MNPAIEIFLFVFVGFAVAVLFLIGLFLGPVWLKILLCIAYFAMSVYGFGGLFVMGRKRYHESSD